jgi:pimeloyl-ACP methyl ester carboxylesterase
MNKALTCLAIVLTIVAAILALQKETFSWVDAGGTKLRMWISGNGNPAVVFDTGGGGSLELWGKVPLEVSRFTQVVSYDRAGNGLSDKSANQRDARHVAIELHTALMNAHVASPYILVGHSVGGIYVRVFASLYPNEVAGLVLVDPTQEQTQAWGSQHGFALPIPGRCASDDERTCYEESLTQAHESSVPPNIPVFLIHVMFPWLHSPFPTKELDEIQRTQTERVGVRLKFHKEWLDQIPGAKLIVTENSSHGGINFEEPELVVRTISEAVQLARKATSARTPRN